MSFWVLAGLCLVVPFAWGIGVARFFRLYEARKRRFRPPDDPKSDYSI